jgi:hypothetical protein
VARSSVTQAHDAKSVRALLDLPEIVQFITDLDELHWTGRPGFGSALIKSVYCLPTWSRTARLIAEHDALRDAIGGAPSQWACYRFAEKLRKHGDVLAADVRARRVDVRGLGCQARRIEVALPVRRVRAQVGLDQGVKAASAGAAQHRPVPRVLLPARRGRARVRHPQAPAGLAAAAGAPHRARQPARGPDRARDAGKCDYRVRRTRLAHSAGSRSSGSSCSAASSLSRSASTS